MYYILNISAGFAVPTPEIFEKQKLWFKVSHVIELFFYTSLTAIANPETLMDVFRRRTDFPRCRDDRRESGFGAKKGVALGTNRLSSCLAPVDATPGEGPIGLEKKITAGQVKSWRT
ncbi:hypothetical protein F4810DRAFT_715405 [Camillea tinctor]|nr:hypothetical protein F4810DRAFT_715405 [Camillea tinctor]